MVTMRHTAKCVSGLLGIIILALVPAFYLLAFYQSYVLSIPIQPAILAILAYTAKFTMSTILMLSAVVIYADMVFPLVMCSFAAVFERIEID